MRDYQLYCGDCLDILPTLEAGKIDLVLTDPPYGIAICRNSNRFGVATDSSRKSTNHTWDDKVPGKDVFEQVFRVSKNQIIFGGNYFLEYLYSSPCYIVWDKRGSLPYVPFAPTEWAWTSFDKMPKKYTVINHGFIRDSPESKTGHPTQKPLLLMEQIILDFTNFGDTILDPFMGSGTTGVAALHTGRKFIGIEKDESYFAIAKERIEKAAQMAAGEFVDKRGKPQDTEDLPLFSAKI